MLLILKRHGCEAITIPVDHVHSRNGMFGWFRPGLQFGFGLPLTWMQTRFEAVIGIENAEITTYI